MTPTTWTMRCAATLALELRVLDAEAVAVRIDRGIGAAAVAAIAARPAGLARAVEAAAWVRRAHEQGVQTLTTLFRPDMSDDEFDAVVEFQVAIETARGAA